jgi:hypothetical protein
LILLVNHGGLSFLTVITLLGMLVFAASIKARVMLLVDISHWERFRIARNKCNNLVSNAKITHYSKVSENMRLEKAGSKNWWTLVKSLTGNNECSRTIPRLNIMVIL